MEALRWWLLLLTALMFSMSGCASQGWTASAHHVAFSMTSHPTDSSITEEDTQTAIGRIALVDVTAATGIPHRIREAGSARR